MTTLSSQGPPGIRPVLAPPLAMQATTDIAGFVKQNATPTILTWQVPNDGQLHRCIISFAEVVSTLEVGGQVSWTFTPPGTGTPVTTALAAAGAGVGPNAGNLGNRPMVTVQPGTTVTVSQTTALTGGASIVYAEIWGS